MFTKFRKPSKVEGKKSNREVDSEEYESDYSYKKSVAEKSEVMEKVSGPVPFKIILSNEVNDSTEDNYLDSKS